MRPAGTINWVDHSLITAQSRLTGLFQKGTAKSSQRAYFGSGIASQNWGAMSHLELALKLIPAASLEVMNHMMWQMVYVHICTRWSYQLLLPQ